MFDPRDKDGQTARNKDTSACQPGFSSKWHVKQLIRTLDENLVEDLGVKVITDINDLPVPAPDIPADSVLILSFYEEPQNLEITGTWDLNSLPMKEMQITY